tara:strand:- start:850 stop:1284 length:435 start_codon:yes stop_codon:yes gene_type:complete
MPKKSKINIEKFEEKYNILSEMVINLGKEREKSKIVFRLMKRKIIHNNSIIEYKSTKTINNLRLLLSYLKKHNELKVMYDSYKAILAQFLNLQYNLKYFSSISKQIIPDDELELMVKTQNNIISYVKTMDKKLNLNPMYNKFNN